jgi:hypothetical protein
LWKSLTRGPAADYKNVELCGLERGNLLRAGGERGVRAHINSINSAHTKPVLKQGEINNERGNLWRFPVRFDLFKKMDTIGV